MDLNPSLFFNSTSINSCSSLTKCKSQEGFGPKSHFITDSQTREAMWEKAVVHIALLSDKIANIPQRHKYCGWENLYPSPWVVMFLGTSRAGCLLKDFLLMKWHLSFHFHFFPPSLFKSFGDICFCLFKARTWDTGTKKSYKEKYKKSSCIEKQLN